MATFFTSFHDVMVIVLTRSDHGILWEL
jgi:hypothetical protein